jgi:hypothetical protein
MDPCSLSSIHDISRHKPNTFLLGKSHLDSSDATSSYEGKLLLNFSRSLMTIRHQFSNNAAQCLVALDQRD